ncbi:MAG: hypothetical protein V4622_05720 [Bacteroidota bacterium]
MIQFIKHLLRFIFFALAQALVFNQLEIDFGIQFMIYPLFILLLPHDLNIFLSFIVSFVFGLTIDSISNTFGLHASSALLIAFARPYIFKIFETRDAYDPGSELSLQNMEFRWILSVHGLLLLIHHFWFFLLEIFKFNELLFVFQKTILSLPFSFIICILIQTIFLRKTKLK